MKKQAKAIWNRLKPYLKLKKFWLSLLGLLSIFGVSISPTAQSKIADIAVEIANLIITTGLEQPGSENAQKQPEPQPSQED